MVCIREVQKTLVQSSKRLIEDKIAALGVGSRFRVFQDRIQTPGDGLIIFVGMQDPDSDVVGFHILRTRQFAADYSFENGTHLIRVSTERQGHTASLLATIAHEMVHLRQLVIGDRGHHSARFQKMAAKSAGRMVSTSKHSEHRARQMVPLSQGLRAVESPCRRKPAGAFCHFRAPECILPSPRTC